MWPKRESEIQTLPLSLEEITSSIPSYTVIYFQVMSWWKSCGKLMKLELFHATVRTVFQPTKALLRLWLGLNYSHCPVWEELDILTTLSFLIQEHRQSFLSLRNHFTYFISLGFCNVQHTYPENVNRNLFRGSVFFFCLLVNETNFKIYNIHC